MGGAGRKETRKPGWCRRRAGQPKRSVPRGYSPRAQAMSGKKRYKETGDQVEGIKPESWLTKTLNWKHLEKSME